MAKASFVEQNPDTVKAFVKAFMRGLQDTLKDPLAALDAAMGFDATRLIESRC